MLFTKADTKKELEYGLCQHSTKYACRIDNASELVLNIFLKHVLASASVSCLMVDGTKHPWLHHKEVAPVLV